MSLLSFLGRGSAFADEHNSAFFVSGSDLVIIDCSALLFPKYKKLFSEVQFDSIYIFVTHTHGDHASGIGTVIYYAYYILNKKVTVAAPNESVKNDLYYLLHKIEGCGEECFTLITAEKIHNLWFVTPISTSHADTLQEKCFGYYINANGIKAVFTGDTATLEPFEKYIGTSDELYTEIAVRSGGVHLGYSDNDYFYKKKLCVYAENGIRVYLMHIDNESVIARAFSNSLVELAPLYDFQLYSINY